MNYLFRPGTKMISKKIKIVAEIIWVKGTEANVEYELQLYFAADEPGIPDSCKTFSFHVFEQDLLKYWDPLPFLETI